MHRFVRLSVLSLLFAPIAASAHPGLLDAFGCHACASRECPAWGLKKNEYHCHNTDEGKNATIIDQFPDGLHSAAPATIPRRAQKPSRRRVDPRGLPLTPTEPSLFPSADEEEDEPAEEEDTEPDPYAATYVAIGRRYDATISQLRALALRYDLATRTTLLDVLVIIKEWMQEYRVAVAPAATRILTDQEEQDIVVILNGLRDALQTFRDVQAGGRLR